VTGIAGEVHVYCARTDGGAGDPGLASALCASLDHDERARHDRLLQETDRHHYRAAHALTRLVLSRHQPETAPDAWRFVASAQGRPEIASPPSALRFNLSHTEGLVVCAVAEQREIGVDVEERGRTLDLLALATSVFAGPELALLRAGSSDSEQRRIFFELWTLKEAYLKARGLGLALPLPELCFELEPPRLTSSGNAADPRRWQFLQARPTERHQLALAVQTDRELPVAFHRVSLSQLASGRV
jgi:4'-phosphopantetheinyl transferase